MNITLESNRRSVFAGSRRFLTAAIGGTAMSASLSANGAVISFKDAFEAAVDQDIVAIAVADADVLLVDGGNYYTQGRRLVVVARNVKITEETRIGFFRPDSHPATRSGVAATGPDGPAGASSGCSRSGCPGNPGILGVTGEKGEDGHAATTMLWDVHELTGAGRLTLVAAGQGGGQGQKGGKGGTGGRGGDGSKRSCGGLAGLDTKAGPGDGGPGGAGGPGGKGGAGGTGGAGGRITLSANLTSAINAGNIVVDLNPGRGGAGGEPGDKGNPGGGGNFGGGNSCGGGGNSGVGGPDGSAGTRGDAGPFGSAGTLQYWIGNEIGLATTQPGSTKGEEVVASAAPPIAGKTVRYPIRFDSPPKDRDCPEQAAMVQLVSVPKGQVVIRLDGVRLTSVQGAIGLDQAPVLQPVTEQPSQYEVRATFRRQIVSRPEVRQINAIPHFYVHRSCPALHAEMEVSLLVTPAGAPLGAKLIEAAGKPGPP